MKNKIQITILNIFFCFSLSAQQASENFYYYQGEKIFLQQRTDKMYLKFAPDVNKGQIRSIVNSDSSLMASGTNLSDDHPVHSAIIEAKSRRLFLLVDLRWQGGGYETDNINKIIVIRT